MAENFFMQGLRQLFGQPAGPERVQPGTAIQGNQSLYDQAQEELRQQQLRLQQSVQQPAPVAPAPPVAPVGAPQYSAPLPAGGYDPLQGYGTRQSVDPTLRAPARPARPAQPLEQGGFIRG